MNPHFLIIIFLPLTDFMDHSTKSGALGADDILPVPLWLCFGDDLLACCARWQPQDCAGNRGDCCSAPCPAGCRLLGMPLLSLSSKLVFPGAADTLWCRKRSWLLAGKTVLIKKETGLVTNSVMNCGIIGYLELDGIHKDGVQLPQSHTWNSFKLTRIQYSISKVLIFIQSQFVTMSTMFSPLKWLNVQCKVCA